MIPRTTAFAAALLLAAGIQAGGPGGKPRSRPASGPATATAPAADPDTMKILRRLQSAGDEHPRVAAGIDYLVEMLQAGDSERRAGKVYYQAAAEKQPAKFRIHFDTLRQGDGPRIRNVVDYVFDGSWLTVRKQRVKQMILYQVAPPGKRINALQLGQGPFPVPFGQKAETILKYFAASTRPPNRTDPPGSDYLKLVTRKARLRDLALKWIELWVSSDTGLPVRIVAEDRSENRSTVVFKDVQTPRSFPAGTFDLPKPPRDWEFRVEPYRGRVR